MGKLGRLVPPHTGPLRGEGENRSWPALRIGVPASALTMQLSNGHCGVVLGSIMQKQTRHTDVSAPQSVTDFIQIQTAEKSIKIGFTDRKISPHAGLSAFAAFLHWH